MTLDDAIAHYLRHLAANGCSMHTVRSYRFDLCVLSRFLGARGDNVAFITPADLDAFLTAPGALTRPDGARRAPSTVNRTRATLRSFFRYLQEAGVIGTHPARALRVRQLDAPPPVLLGKTQQSRLLDAIKRSGDPLAPRDAAIVETLLGTGLRIEEVVGLDVHDLDLSGRTLAVSTKGNGRQVRYLTDRLAGELRVYLGWRKTHCNGSAALFIATTGARIGQRHIRRRLHAWLQHAGVEGRITPHSFRHTLAVRLLERTGNLRLVQQALGHRSIASTLRYTRVSDARLRAALEAV